MIFALASVTRYSLLACMIETAHIHLIEATPRLCFVFYKLKFKRKFNSGWSRWIEKFALTTAWSSIPYNQWSQADFTLRYESRIDLMSVCMQSRLTHVMFVFVSYSLAVLGFTPSYMHLVRHVHAWTYPIAKSKFDFSRSRAWICPDCFQHVLPWQGLFHDAGGAKLKFQAQWRLSRIRSKHQCSIEATCSHLKR